MAKIITTTQDKLLERTTNLENTKQNAEDNDDLNTDDRSIVGAINEVLKLANDGGTATTNLEKRVTAVEIINKAQDGAISTAQTKANDAYNLAAGRKQGYVFESLSEMTTSLKTADKNTYKVGDNLYIKATGVPDYWVSGTLSTNTGTYGFYEISLLETEKVDLSGYSEKEYTVSDVTFDSSKVTLSYLDGSTREVSTDNVFLEHGMTLETTDNLVVVGADPQSVKEVSRQDLKIIANSDTTQTTDTIPVYTGSGYKIKSSTHKIRKSDTILSTATNNVDIPTTEAARRLIENATSSIWSAIKDLQADDVSLFKVTSDGTFADRFASNETYYGYDDELLIYIEFTDEDILLTRDSFSSKKISNVVGEASPRTFTGHYSDGKTLYKLYLILLIEDSAGDGKWSWKVFASKIEEYATIE